MYSFFFYFKQKTAYDMRISDWSSDVCSSDLPFGNLVYRGVDRNLNPVIAKAATRTVAESSWIVNLGEIAPADITTPGAYVDHVIACDDRHAPDRKSDVSGKSVTVR